MSLSDRISYAKIHVLLTTFKFSPEQTLLIVSKIQVFIFLPRLLQTSRLLSALSRYSATWRVINCASGKFKTVFSPSQPVKFKSSIHHMTMPTGSLFSIFPRLLLVVLTWTWISSPPFLIVASKLLAYVSLHVPSYPMRKKLLFFFYSDQYHILWAQSTTSQNVSSS